MALYMTRFAYTAQAWAALANNQLDRRAPVGALVRKSGGQLKELYYWFGEYDGVLIFEPPDEVAAVAAAAVAVAASLPGHIEAIKTTRLLTTDDDKERAVATTESPSYDQLLSQGSRLPPTEQLRILEDLAALVRHEMALAPARTVTALRGLGNEIWQGIDAQEYVDRERAAWDG